VYWNGGSAYQIHVQNPVGVQQGVAEVWLEPMPIMKIRCTIAYRQGPWHCFRSCLYYYFQTIDRHVGICHCYC
jgi:hypothetical protein